MTHKKVPNGYIVRLDKDEKLIEQLKKFALTHKIKSGWLSGLGAAAGATLGFYDVDNQQYEWHDITSLAEITNLTGNIAWHKDDPVVHVHGTFSSKNLKAYGGHVKELIVGGTCEIFITEFDQTITRKHDDNTGLTSLEI